MNYKITSDLSKVKKEKCDCLQGYIVLYPPVKCFKCNATGTKPIKITYKAGECPHSDVPIDDTDENVLCHKGCHGTGKLHPKVDDVVEIDLSEYGVGCQDCLRNKVHTIYDGHNKEKYKFLSINTNKEEAVVVIEDG